MISKKTGTILFIVEGESREIKYFENIQRFWFKNKNAKLLALPAGENIYMLWQTIKEDDFETDLIEVLKENLNNHSLYNLSNAILENINNLNVNDIDEIFLFFDLDPHANNLPDNIDKNQVIKDMLNTFDNETENGKLYISYPMIEAIRDWIPNSCKTITNCTYKINELNKYKSVSSNNLTNNPFNYSQIEWANVLTNFIFRISRLFNYNNVISFEEYRKVVNSISIFQLEIPFINNNLIYILSAIPEFILDYFNEKHWNNYIKRKRLPKCILNDIKCLIK